ncbi:outer membrane protein assembly factor BamE [Pseudomonas alcaligenes]|uniref:outer membrane protein assembly factor BamE n=1 Tax=Pseudomonas sp. RIT-PI-AD TaxID=3035294 RepID=UPI0021D9E32E
MQKHERNSPGGHIVGLRRERTCGADLEDNERRRAMVRHEIRSGMTRAEVESVLGKPDKVSGKDGQVRYQYSEKHGKQQTVNFDEAGCVKGKR